MTQTIGRYEVERKLGEGGMAVVYLARDPLMKRQVAVKVLPRQFTDDPHFRARFQREAEIIAALEHPHIVPVFDFGEHDEQPFIVMRYMSGGSLADRLRRGPLPLAEVARILGPLAAALDEAHSKNIIHRDLKPANILFDGRGDPYISDFGIAKLIVEATTRFTGNAILGTPMYMSPEQWRADKTIDGRSDVYALGGLLFEMLTGHPPYEADTPAQLMYKHLAEPPPRLINTDARLPDGCDSLIAKAMAKERDERYSSASELADELNRLATASPTRPEPIAPPPPTPKSEPTPVQVVVHPPTPEHATPRLPAKPTPGDLRPTIDPETQPKPERAPTPAPVAVIPPRSGIRRKRATIVGGVALVAIAALAFGVWWRNRSTPAITQAPIATPTLATTEALKPTEAPPAFAQTQAANIELTLWHPYIPGSVEQAALTMLIGNANRYFQSYTIRVVQVPFSDIFNKYQTEVAAGGGPDMFLAPNDDLGNWARGGLVLNLDDKLAGKLGSVPQVSLDGMKVDDRLYGVPESAKAVALYYNKSLIDNPPKTTDELLQAVKDGKSLTLFLGAYHMFGFTGAFGGKLMDDTGKCVADLGGWAEAMQYILDLKAAGATIEPDYGIAEAPFRQGQAAMFVNGPWALADYKNDLGDRLGVVPMPSGPGGNANPLNGIDGFYINPNSTKVDAAVELALFLTNAESSQIWTNEAGHVPVGSGVKPNDPLLAGFAEASASGFPRPQSEEFGNFWGPFGDAWTKVIEGALTPDEAVKEACAAMNTANGISIP